MDNSPVPRPMPPALVLTAGLGTRLAPLTDVRAKPAVPVAGVPLVTRVLRWLAEQGVTSTVLNLHHRPETITRHVGHGSDVGLHVRYSWESTLLGTAGGARHALDLLGERFFIVNGDTLTDVDLGGLLEAHERADAAVTLAVSDNPDPSRYGGVVVDDGSRVTGFTRTGQPAGHFPGVQIVCASAFASLADGEPAATVGQLYDTLIQSRAGAVSAHRVGAVAFYDVGTPTDYHATCLAIASHERHTTVPRGSDSWVHPTAVLSGTIVWDDVRIDEGCHLTDCIVADGVRLRPGTRAERQMIIATTDGVTCTPLDPAS